jgi:hypothetical protein
MFSWSVSPDMTGPQITIVYADDRYKVFRNGEQLRVPMSTGKTLPVEFETREAAEGYVRVYKIMTRGRDTITRLEKHLSP